MRIGIDGVALTIKFPCGTRVYASQLIAHLAKIDRKNEYIVFAHEPIALPKQDNFIYSNIPIPFPYFKRQFFFPFCVNKQHIDIFHYLHPYGAVFFFHPKIVTTILDIRLNEIFRSVYDPKHMFQYFYATATRFGVFRQTNRFICISDTIKNELKHTFHIDKPIDTIPLGTDSIYTKHYKTILQNKKNYIIAFADYSPRKNISGVIKAYSILPSSLKHQYRLKIIISTTFPVKKIYSELNNLKPSNNIDLLINISNRELSHYYTQARVLVFPSFYEGFGLPILEAMASGCPVITSNFGAMKEVAGNAAYLVNPYSTAEISHAVKILLAHPNMQKTLIRKGRERAEIFTWEHTAYKTLKVYEEVFQS